jgi:hypothetical protein
MKRIAPFLLIAVMLAGGWFTGRRLAQPDGSASPQSEARGKATDKFTGVSSEKRTSASSRNFAGEWDAALATGEWNSRKGPGVLYVLMVEWLKNDPRAALAGVQRLAQIEASKRIAGAALTLSDYLFDQWVAHHGWESAWDAARALEGEERKRALAVVGKEAIMRSDNPAERLRSLLTGADPAAAKEMAVNCLRFWAYRADAPASAATDWVDSLPSGTFDAGGSVILDRAAAQARLHKDPRGAAEWLMSRATGETRAGHLESIVTQWVQDAPNACGKWLREQPAGPHADAAYQSFVIHILREDPDSAWHWAQRISDPQKRDILSQSVMEKWRIMDPAAADAAKP